MSQRNYSNTAQPTSLSSGVSDSDTTLTVPSTSGYPTAPFTIALDRGNANEEIVLVQGKTGTTFTNCVRGWDGTTAQTHLASVSVEHVVVAADAEDANHHVYDTGRDDHCFSEDTEILTEVGWLGIDAIAEGVKAWTFNLDTEMAELEEIEAVWRYGQDEFPELVSLQTQDLGQVLVTPKHTMIWRRANAKNQKAWARRDADTMPQQFSIPASAQGHLGEIEFSDDQIRLLAWATTEGYVGDGFVSISQKNGPLADRIRGIFDRLGYAYSEYKQSGDMRAFRTTAPFLMWAMDAEKVPRQDFLGMSYGQARLFVAEAVLGDGSVSGGDKLSRIDSWLAGGTQPSMVLASKSTRYIDFVQTICVLNGIKTRDYVDTDGFHRLSIKSTREHSFACSTSSSASVEIVSNDIGDVWCVTVGGNHSVIARRPGTAPFIAGNTQYLTSARHAALDHDAIISSATLPVGSSVDWWGASDPAGGKWLICDGRAVSRTTYADLFSELGTTHGAGDGSTTFNIPDSRGRFTLHIDSGTGRVTDANAANIGGTGGAELVTLTAAQIPTHLHSVSITSSTAGNHSHENVTGTTASGGSHDHYLAGNTTGNAGGQLQYVASADTPGNPVGDTLFGLHKSNTAGRGKTYDDGAHTHTFSGSTGTTGNHTHAITGNTGSVGGGGSHQNMPPWIACNKIIRALP